MNVFSGTLVSTGPAARINASNKRSVISLINKSLSTAIIILYCILSRSRLQYRHVSKILALAFGFDNSNLLLFRVYVASLPGDETVTFLYNPVLSSYYLIPYNFLRDMLATKQLDKMHSLYDG